jgi:hypothetical protein
MPPPHPARLSRHQKQARRVSHGWTDDEAGGKGADSIDDGSVDSGGEVFRVPFINHGVLDRLEIVGGQSAVRGTRRSVRAPNVHLKRGTDEITSL